VAKACKVRVKYIDPKTGEVLGYGAPKLCPLEIGLQIVKRDPSIMEICERDIETPDDPRAIVNPLESAATTFKRQNKPEFHAKVGK